MSAGRGAAGSATIRRFLCTLPALVVLACLRPPLAAAQVGSIEVAIKATYLTKFPPYVDWPAGAVAKTDRFTICVVGDDPFGSLLDRVAGGQQIANRPIVLRRLPVFDAGAACLLVFAAGSQHQSVQAILAAAQGQPVLTVTDTAAAAQAKGIINFVVADDRVRFEIDDATATAAGFTISSKLLSLAINTHSGN
jgi:hypothetical protein